VSVGKKMVDYPYMIKPSAVEDFLKNLPNRPEPAKVTIDYMKKLGYKSSNDYAAIAVLKYWFP
jgi:hypothetical protein